MLKNALHRGIHIQKIGGNCIINDNNFLKRRNSKEGKKKQFGFIGAASLERTHKNREPDLFPRITPMGLWKRK